MLKALRKIWELISRWDDLYLLGYILSHTVVGCFVLLSIWFIEQFTFRLWHTDEERMFFGRIPIAYFFDAMHAAVLAALIVYLFGMLAKVLWKHFRQA